MLNSSVFEVFIMFLIIGNMIILAIEYDDMPASFNLILKNFDTVFTIAFILECFLKVYVMGVNIYLKSNWNK